MYEKQCNLSRAAKCFGGGGGGGASLGPGGTRVPKKELPTIQNWDQWQIGNAAGFRDADKLLGPATTGATDWFKNRLPQMLGQFPGFQSEITGAQNQIKGYQGQLGDIYGKMGKEYGTVQGWLGAPGGPAGIIASGGALTPGLARDVAQQGRGIASAQGVAVGPGAAGQELLNRDAYRQARLTQAQQTGQSMLGLGQNILQGQAGVTGQGAGLSGLLAGLTGQKSGLLGQEQALQTGGLNQLISVGNAATNQYTGLTNPILSYLGNLFSGNQQAAVAQAQIAAQQQAAGDSKKAGGTSAIGSVIGAVLPLLFCDERLKANIKKTGLQTPEGIPIKTFEYKTRPGVPFVGVMAQDVEKKVPEAVVTEPLSGLKMLGFRFAPAQIKKEV